MPWYAWYILIGIGWTVFRAVFLFFAMRFAPQVRSATGDFTPLALVFNVGLWVFDAPYFAWLMLSVTRTIWSQYWTLRRMRPKDWSA